MTAVQVASLVFGGLASLVLVLLLLAYIIAAEYPDKFNDASMGLLALAVLMFIVYGILVNAWYIWLPFCALFLTSFVVILRKHLAHRREQASFVI